MRVSICETQNQALHMLSIRVVTATPVICVYTTGMGDVTKVTWMVAPILQFQEQHSVTSDVCL